MTITDFLFEELNALMPLQGIIDLIRSGDYSSLRTWSGITRAIGPLLPLILLLELCLAFFHKHIGMAEYKIPFLIYVFNRAAGKYISFGLVAFCIGWLSPFRLLDVSFTWYGFLYGYIVWEFGHFIYHFLAHKVRLFWCLHSTHHAPEQMNLSVSYAHFLLEAPYADFIRTSVCIMLGVPPEMLFAIMFIDGTWGMFIHVGERVMKNARMGWVGNLILTPSHHRVHHARNPLYMDTNFCNLLNIWDRIFRTYQPEKEAIPVEYGITRPIKSASFLDVYFGEWYYLAQDVWQAPGLLNKLRYLVMPPGWHHEGQHKTAAVMRQQWLSENPS